MKKKNPVLTSTLYVAGFTAVLSLLMHAVFMILRQWDLTVLWGNLLTFAVSVLNFVLLAWSVVFAVKKDTNRAKVIMKLSQMGRMLLIFAVLAIGFIFGKYLNDGCFNEIAVVLTLVFSTVSTFIGNILSLSKGAAEQAPKASPEENAGSADKDAGENGGNGQ